MKVKLCLFLGTTAHCHDRAAIKIHITHFTRIFNDHFFYKRTKELWAAEIQIIAIVFGTNIPIYILIRRIIYSKIARGRHSSNPVYLRRFKVR